MDEVTQYHSGMDKTDKQKRDEDIVDLLTQRRTELKESLCSKCRHAQHRGQLCAEFVTPLKVCGCNHREILGNPFRLDEMRYRQLKEFS